MAKPTSDWQARPHEPVQTLAENLRWVRAPIPGVSIKRTMTVARLANGRLVIWSAVALDEPSMQELEAWGTPGYLIVPSALHRLDAAAYKARYPGLRCGRAIGLKGSGPSERPQCEFARWARA